MCDCFICLDVKGLGGTVRHNSRKSLFCRTYSRCVYSRVSLVCFGLPRASVYKHTTGACHVTFIWQSANTVASRSTQTIEDNGRYSRFATDIFRIISSDTDTIFPLPSVHNNNELFNSDWLIDFLIMFTDTDTEQRVYTNPFMVVTVTWPRCV